MPCKKKCGTILSVTNKCYTCGNDNQNIEVEPLPVNRRRTLIIRIGLSVGFSIIAIIISLMAIFWKPILNDRVYRPADNSISIKILVFIIITIAVLNLVTAAFTPRLKKWIFHLYIAFSMLNCFISFVIFTMSNFLSGRALSVIYQTFLSFLQFK